jgi:polyisoprenyl-phosphate glycosyltransferase
MLSPIDPELSVVVPIYNEAGNIPTFLAHLLPILRAETRSYEVIFCADPCTDESEKLVMRAREEDDSIKLVIFSRRFGQPAATLAGIELATGAAVLVMDVDLQDPPELIPEMLGRWRAGAATVLAQRTSRKGETLIKRAVSNAGYRLINRISDVDIPPDTGDFRLMDRRVVDQLLRFTETHGFLRGLVALVGFEQATVEFERPARYSGRGNYNRFLGSLKIGLNGVIGFSTALLSLSTLVGFASAAFAFVFAIAYGVVQLAGRKFPVGNPTIVVLILLLGGMQLICLGIMGQYIGRIYEETKRRPRFVVDRAAGFDLIQGNHVREIERETADDRR